MVLPWRILLCLMLWPLSGTANRVSGDPPGEHGSPESELPLTCHRASGEQHRISPFLFFPILTTNGTFTDISGISIGLATSVIASGPPATTSGFSKSVA